MNFEGSAKFSPYYSSLKKDIKVIQNIESILDKIESEGNISLLTQTFEMIFNKEMVYAVQELKKMRLKQPKLDLKTQLTNNTEIFKENLKTITVLLIDSVWKDKVSSQKIQQTIDWASQLIYKGNFEEIKEVEEEQMYNSWMFQKNENEKFINELQNDSKFEVPSKENFEAKEENQQNLSNISHDKSEQFLDFSSDFNQESIEDHKDIKNRLVGKIRKSLEEEKTNSDLMSKFSSNGSIILDSSNLDESSYLDEKSKQKINTQIEPINIFRKNKEPEKDFETGQKSDRFQKKKGKMSADRKNFQLNNFEIDKNFQTKSIHDTLIDKLEKLQQQKIGKQFQMNQEHFKTSQDKESEFQTVHSLTDLSKFNKKIANITDQLRKRDHSNDNKFQSIGMQKKYFEKKQKQKSTKIRNHSSSSFINQSNQSNHMKQNFSKPNNLRNSHNLQNPRPNISNSVFRSFKQ